MPEEVSCRRRLERFPPGASSGTPGGARGCPSASSRSARGRRRPPSRATSRRAPCPTSTPSRVSSSPAAYASSSTPSPSGCRLSVRLRALRGCARERLSGLAPVVCALAERAARARRRPRSPARPLVNEPIDLDAVRIFEIRNRQQVRYVRAAVGPARRPRAACSGRAEIRARRARLMSAFRQGDMPALDDLCGRRVSPRLESLRRRTLRSSSRVVPGQVGGTGGRAVVSAVVRPT